MSETRARGWVAASGALSVVAGIAVLAVFVWRVGPAQIAAGILNVGWMFPVIVALGGLRFMVRAWAWCICVEPPHALRVRHALAAVLAGDAVGNATPLGPLVGEPAKAAYVTTHLPLQPALTALAIENIFYTLSTAAMIVAGTIALLFAFELPGGLRELSELAVLAVVALLSGSLWILWQRPALISRWLPSMFRPGTRMHSSLGRIRALEEEIYSFATRRRAAVLPVILLDGSFHALGVLEAFLAMWMILGRPPALIEAFILETAHRLITVAFKFIPGQIGVSQVGTGGVTAVLGMGAPAGVTLSIVRTARMGVWALIGAAVLLRGRQSRPPVKT